MPCCLEGRYQCFGGTSFLHRQARERLFRTKENGSTFLLNVGTDPNYTASQPKRRKSVWFMFDVVNSATGIHHHHIVKLQSV
jgi:hypothetical protein